MQSKDVLPSNTRVRKRKRGMAETDHLLNQLLLPKEIFCKKHVYDNSQ
jgi:hypothetical protein